MYKNSTLLKRVSIYKTLLDTKKSKGEYMKNNKEKLTRYILTKLQEGIPYLENMIILLFSTLILSY